MCYAFSCLCDESGKVTWKMGVDSHHTLVDMARYNDNTYDRRQMKFARIEISPKNKNYINPDEWEFHIDESIKPHWFGENHKIACLLARAEWSRQLNAMLAKKQLVSPFAIKTPAVTNKHIALASEWNDVLRSSNGTFAKDVVFGTLTEALGETFSNSIYPMITSLGTDVIRAMRINPKQEPYVWQCIWAYVGSAFSLPKWNTGHNIPGYPFESVARLMEDGLVPCYDGQQLVLYGANGIVWREGDVIIDVPSRSDIITVPERTTFTIPQSNTIMVPEKVIILSQPEIVKEENLVTIVNAPRANRAAQ